MNIVLNYIFVSKGAHFMSHAMFSAKDVLMSSSHSNSNHGQYQMHDVHGE